MIAGRFVHLSAAASLAYCSYAMCRLPILPLLARSLGATPPMVGLVVAASTITGVLLKLPAGTLSDVMGRGPLLLAAGLVFGCMPFSYLLAPGLIWLVAIRFVHGSATAIAGPVVSAALSDLAPPDRRGQWLATYAAVQGAGQASGPLVCGMLIASFGYDAAFVTSGALGLAALSLYATLPAGRAVAPHPAWWREAAMGVHEVAKDARLIATSIAQAGMFVLSGSLNAFLPLFAHETLGLSIPDTGLVVAAQIVATLMSRPLVGRWSDTTGRRRVIVSGLLLCSASIALVSVAQGLTSLLVAAMLFGLGVAVTGSAASAHITDLSPQARYGAAHGVFGTVYDVGDAAGPLLAGLLLSQVGYARMFQVMAVGGAMVALWFSVGPGALRTEKTG